MSKKMNAMNHSTLSTLSLVLSAAFLPACSQSSDRPTGTVSQGPGTSPGGPGVYTLTFEGFEELGYSGLLAGDTTNLRFALNWQQTHRTYTALAISKHEGNYLEITPAVVLDYDKVALCAEHEQAYKGFTELPPGQPADVDYVDVTMSSELPSPPDGSSPESETSNRMCFGYRQGGAWQWRLTPQSAIWDGASQKYRIRLGLQQDGVDAVKIAFNSGTTRRVIEKIELSAKPQAASSP